MGRERPRQREKWGRKAVRQLGSGVQLFEFHQMRENVKLLLSFCGMDIEYLGIKPTTKLIALLILLALKLKL